MTHAKRYISLLVLAIAAGTTILAAAPAKKEQTAATSPATTQVQTASDVKGAAPGEAVPLIQSNTQRSPIAAPASPVVTASTPAANYTMGWSSINSGGTISASSPSYQAGVSVGQSVAGAASSPSYQMGIGFWYGAGGCSCPHQGDINGDGVIDVFDVIGVIGIAFSGDTDPQDTGCPDTRGDVDNNGVSDVFDVIYLIATAFSGGPSPVDPCA